MQILGELLPSHGSSTYRGSQNEQILEELYHYRCPHLGFSLALTSADATILNLFLSGDLGEIFCTTASPSISDPTMEFQSGFL